MQNLTAVFINSTLLQCFRIAIAFAVITAVEAETSAILVQDNASQYFHSGNYSAAIKLWKIDLNAAKKNKQQETRARLLDRIADAYLALGQVSLTLNSLKLALKITETLSNPILQIRISAKLANLYVQEGDYVNARKLLEQSEQKAATQNNSQLLAAILNDLGGLYVAKRNFNLAKSKFIQSLTIARENTLADQEVKVLLNLAAVEILRREDSRSIAYSIKAWQAINQLGSKRDHMKYSIRLSEILVNSLSTNQKIRKSQVTLAYDILVSIKTELTTIDSKHDSSLVQGLLAELYLSTGNINEVEKLFFRAIFLAQGSSSEDLLYRWHWQLARYQRSSGQVAKAIASYRQARVSYQKLNPLFTWTHLNPAREDDTPSKFHFEFADLLLESSKTLENEFALNLILNETRDIIEELKSNELQDYFKDSCVARTRQQLQKVPSSLNKMTAILYPILFKDRIEILVSHKGEISRFTSQVSSRIVKQSIGEFRTKLEKRRTRDYIPLAKQLYGWIIAPISRFINERSINTLVLIPDVTMRALSFAALYDGEKFLIEKYALAISPGMELTDQQYVSRGNTRVFLGGLTESVAGLPALSHVAVELDSISKIFESETILDKKFNRKALQNSLAEQQFGIAHIASHGKFTGNVDQSYIVTYDGRVTVQQLAQSIGASQFRTQPIELLTLSACYTAAGDEKAALGLAGITVKAGARSALASLWQVNDIATAVFMKKFYTLLATGSASKAEVLRNTQLRMLRDKRYRHPGYWAAFILIGNWL